jgi:serine/threonine protein kinase
MSGEPPKKPSVELFTFGETLGVGAFGKVVLATHKETGEQFAAKVLRCVFEGLIQVFM